MITLGYHDVNDRGGEKSDQYVKGFDIVCSSNKFIDRWG
jgi:hypothetical protein